MKIVELVPNLFTGGVQTFAVHLSEELSKNPNNEIYLVSFWDGKSDRFANLPSQIHVLSLGKQKGFSLRFVHVLNKCLKKIKPDVINTHGERTLIYLLLTRVGKKAKIVHTITSDANYRRKSFTAFIRFWIQIKKSNIHIVGITQSIAENAKTIYRTSYVTNIDNGIVHPNDDLFSIKKKYTFIYCGAFEDVKRCDLLINAFSCLSIKEATLLMVGDGQNRSMIEALIQKNKLENRVFLTGNVSNPMPFYAQSEFFVLTSRTEGLPISLLEAMSLGLIPIVPNVGGIPDAVKDGKSGFLFDKNSSPEFIARLYERILQLPPAEKKSISSFNIQFAQKWYMSEIANQYQHLYDQFIK
jgi:glycosyltransferase involved in cell wall biosynthesis